MRKQRKNEDFWDEHKNFQSKSSSNQSDSAKSSLNGYSSDEEILEKGENGGDDIQKDLGDNNGGYH